MRSPHHTAAICGSDLHNFHGVLGSADVKIVLNTGANQGIGFEITKSLSSKPGYHVLLGSRDDHRGIKAAKDLKDQGLDVEPISIDRTLYVLINQHLCRRAHNRSLYSPPQRIPKARTVFMSSITGSLTHRPVDLPVYRSSNTALNMLMLHYAFKFKDAGWKVNARCPGYCATNLNDFAGMDTPENGALNAVRLATLGEYGETGTFTSKEVVIAW
ncbi:hypothetical protein V1508DRAFT_449932 [Lipomyces doorenjongii]|uniref:uncharacterized protein n=1 Tax=Lipomyces doorenjongii TaxID=383834 RepID=UPI0034CD5ED1